MALTTILLDNDGTLVDTYNMILESFKHATQEVLGKQFSEAEYMAKVGQPLATQSSTSRAMLKSSSAC